MGLSKANFDVTNPVVVLRMMCGLFYIPHILFKLNGFDGALAFFGKAGFNPPLFFVSLALVTETICMVGLTLGLFTRYVGLMSAGVMGVAAVAIFNTKGYGWLWNLGGIEYLVFWGVGSLAVAAQAWKEHLSRAKRPLTQPASAAALR